MAMFNTFEHPKNPFRKRGTDYPVSKKSQLAGDDFGYSNALCSRLYGELKPIQRMACTRSTYRGLQDRLYQAIRNDRVHELGSLRLGYGDVSPLKGFRFSEKISLNRFFINSPVVHFNPQKSSVEMQIDLNSLRSFEDIHDRLVKLVLKMFCIVIQVDDKNEIRGHASKDLELSQDHIREKRTALFSLPDTRDAVILCMGTVRCWLSSPDAQDEFLSNNTNLMTGEVIEAILVRDGERVVFEDKVSTELKPPIQPHDDDVDWI